MQSKLVMTLLEIFAKSSIPEVLISDNCSNFKGRLTDEFKKILGISPRFSSPLHPEGNGFAERNIQNVKNSLHHIIREHGSDWDKFLPFVTWGLREVLNATTGVSAMQMVWGRQKRGPVSVLKDVWSGDLANLPILPKPMAEYLCDLRELLQLR